MAEQQQPDLPSVVIDTPTTNVETDLQKNTSIIISNGDQNPAVNCDISNCNKLNENFPNFDENEEEFHVIEFTEQNKIDMINILNEFMPDFNQKLYTFNYNNDNNEEDCGEPYNNRIYLRLGYLCQFFNEFYQINTKWPLLPTMPLTLTSIKNIEMIENDQQDTDRYLYQLNKYFCIWLKLFYHCDDILDSLDIKTPGSTEMLTILILNLFNLIRDSLPQIRHIMDKYWSVVNNDGLGNGLHILGRKLKPLVRFDNLTVILLQQLCMERIAFQKCLKNEQKMKEELKQKQMNLDELKSCLDTLKTMIQKGKQNSSVVKSQLNTNSSATSILAQPQPTLKQSTELMPNPQQTAANTTKLRSILIPRNNSSNHLRTILPKPQMAATSLLSSNQQQQPQMIIQTRKSSLLQQQQNNKIEDVIEETKEEPQQDYDDQNNNSDSSENSQRKRNRQRKFLNECDETNLVNNQMVGGMVTRKHKKLRLDSQQHYQPSTITAGQSIICPSTLPVPPPPMNQSSSLATVINAAMMHDTVNDPILSRTRQNIQPKQYNRKRMSLLKSKQNKPSPPPPPPQAPNSWNGTNANSNIITEDDECTHYIKVNYGEMLKDKPKEKISSFYRSKMNNNNNGDGGQCVVYQHCRLCEKTFLNFDNFRQHLYKHEGPLFECNICTKMFPTRNQLGKHMPMHPRLFQCNYCQNSFLTFNNLNVHMKHCEQQQQDQQRALILNNNRRTYGGKLTTKKPLTKCKSTSILVKNQNILLNNEQEHNVQEPINGNVDGSIEENNSFETNNKEQEQQNNEDSGSEEDYFESMNVSNIHLQSN